MTSAVLDVVSEAEFITVPEWAKRVGLSRNSGYRAVDAGEVPGAVRFGGRIVINWLAFLRATYTAS